MCVCVCQCILKPSVYASIYDFLSFFSLAITDKCLNVYVGLYAFIPFGVFLALDAEDSCKIRFC